MVTNVTQWLDHTVEKFPEKKAFIDGTEELTFREFRDRSMHIATRLIRMGLRKKAVAVLLEKNIKMLSVFLGIAYSDNFYSPLAWDMPESRVRRILDVFKPEAIVTTKEKEHYLREDIGYSGEIIIYETEMDNRIDQDGVHAIQKKICDTDLLYVLFTSGSTGIPKGVTICHRSVIDYINWITENFKIESSDVFGNQAPFYFDNSILDIYSAIKTGATLVIIPEKLFSQPVMLLNYMLEKEVNTIFWVPSALIVVSRLKALELVELGDSLKRILFCGEVMPNKCLNYWRKHLPHAVYANLYGPTEITDACTCYVVDRSFQDDEPLPIGKPMDNTDILVLNERDELVTGSETGELCVRGSSLSYGYYNNPEKTEEVFVQNPLNTSYRELLYRTGDLVRYNSRNELMFVSRKDFQIKNKGYRIELGEIETIISSFNQVERVCCLFDAERSKIVLFIEGSMEEALLKEKIKKELPVYMRPSKIVYLNELPLNCNGKIDRVALKQLM